MPTPFQIIVEGSPIIIYASRNGSPPKVLLILEPFLDKFWSEREISGEDRDTPGCLVAQIVVRFGYEICEDDFSNLRVGLDFDSEVQYIYQVLLNHKLKIWKTTPTYDLNPTLGLAACQEWNQE